MRPFAVTYPLEADSLFDFSMCRVQESNLPCLGCHPISASPAYRAHVLS